MQENTSYNLPVNNNVSEKSILSLYSLLRTAYNELNPGSSQLWGFWTLKAPNDNSWTSRKAGSTQKAPFHCCVCTRVSVYVCTHGLSHIAPFLSLSGLMTLLVDLLIACNTTGFSWGTCDLPSRRCHPQWKAAPKLGCFDCCWASPTWLVKAEPSQLPSNKLLKPVPSEASVNSWRSWLFTLQDRYAIKLWQKGLPDH